MAQAKGILPRREDRVIKSPAAEGYFISVSLLPDITRPEVEALLRDHVSRLVDELVARLPDDYGGPNRLAGIGSGGDRVAAVAVGFAPSFFLRDGAARFDPPLQLPACLTSLPPNVPGTSVSAEIMFYVVSLSEARVCAFISGLWAARPNGVVAVDVDRGYQRLDGTEAFGYADGLRNVSWNDRFGVAFIHRDDGEIEEPPVVEGGSYMAYLKIVQNPDAFAQLDATQQDQVIGRQRDGTRLDLVGQNVPPRREPSEPPPDGLPAASHVRKVGPRGPHDDVQIFRRGLPFIETVSGQVRVGLQFVSFQASLDQFDVVFNDWMMNPHFPTQGGGVDALLDPARAFATIERHGFFFIPPYEEGRFIGATLFEEDTEGRGRRRTTGRIAIRKRVVDPNNPGARFERGGFRFQIIDQATGSVVAELTTDSKGHAITEALEIDKTYVLRELPHPERGNIQPAPDDTFVLDRPRMVRRPQNTITQPGPYGVR
jgi:deferrochelatase/peroxidase EfeB